MLSRLLFLAPKSNSETGSVRRTVWRAAGLGLVVGAVAVTGGCSGFKDAMGLSKHPPDEFAVVTKSPLVIPPDYNLMPPPPDVQQPRNADPQAEAIQALFPDHKVAPPSQSEAMLIQKTGAKNVSSDIRTKIGGESTQISDRGADAGKVLYDNSVSVANEPKKPEIERRTPAPVEQIH